MCHLGRARLGFFTPHLQQSRALGRYATAVGKAAAPASRPSHVLKTPGFPLLQMHAAPPYKGTPARAFRRPFAKFTFHVLCLKYGKQSKAYFPTHQYA
jgi:hypothetical protein